MGARDLHLHLDEQCEAGDPRGRRCRILVRGTKRSVLVEFADNRQRECVDFYALRRVPDQGALFYEPVTE